MNAPTRRNRGLLVEALETRTLLAADDPFGLIADFDLTMQAVTGVGEVAASFDTRFGNRQLALTGNSEGTIVIDLNKLPDFITNLRITSVSEVVFIGTDEIQTLVLKDIDFVSAPDLTVLDSLHATDVASLSVAFAGETTMLKGSKMALNARSIDGHFGIFSHLDELTLTTESDVLLFTSMVADQTLYLTNLPKVIVPYGIDSSSIRIGLPPVVETPPDPGSEIPHEPAPGTSDPDTPVTPAPNVPDRVVIITLPADERTRAFIAELREVLRTRSADPQQFVLEFLNRTHAESADATSSMLADHAFSAIGNRSFDFTELSEDLLAFATGTATHHAAADSPFASYDFSLEPSPRMANGTLAGARLPDAMVPAPDVNIDLFWPAAALRSGNPSSPNFGDDETETTALSIEESLQAFGTYIVERVSAEFFPGQQSLVLLVDPKPSRAAGIGRKSILDQFASDGSRVADTASAVA